MTHEEVLMIDSEQELLTIKAERKAVKTKIVYVDSKDVWHNKNFESFEAASGLIESLDRQGISYDWYEFVNGRWFDASAVTVMQDDEDEEDLLRYLAGQAA